VARLAMVTDFLLEDVSGPLAGLPAVPFPVKVLLRVRGSS
jgi:hypothetical protein